MTSKLRIEKAINDLFDKKKKITQKLVAKKSSITLATVRYHWHHYKSQVREMNHVTIPETTNNPLTKWRYTRHHKKLEINKLYVEDCLVTMKRMPDNLLDLTVTSPPYDQLRHYNGNHDFNFQAIAKQLFRVTKRGGVLVWVVGDATVNGSETGTSFKQALYFMSLGFRLHDTMIYEKNTSSFPAKRTGNRYTQIFEYCFVFSKGQPKTVNLIADKKNKWAGVTNWGRKTHRRRDGTLILTKDINPVPTTSVRNNIWKYNVGAGFITKDKHAHEHPAIFPEQLAADHIMTWSREGDLVYDCFAGSSTVLKSAKKLGRRFVGSEINSEYAKLFL